MRVGSAISTAVGVAAGIAIGFYLDDDLTDAATSTGISPASSDSAGVLRPPREPLNDLGEIAATLPDGFEIEAYAEGLPYPTATAVATDGTVYFAGLQGPKGTVYVLNDSDGDGIHEYEPVADGFEMITGLLIHGEMLLVASRGTVSVLRGLGSKLTRSDIITRLPAEYPVHSNQSMAIGPDGRLYFGVGATCNACNETNPVAATILSCELDGSDCRVFAKGLRNAFDLAFHPIDGALFTTDNGAEAIGGAQIEIEDEIDVVEEGLDYGWPFCWGRGRGLHCGDTAPALAELIPHSAPAGLAFYTGDSFPQSYRNNLFIALWGNSGRSVIRVQLTKNKDGTYVSTISDFVRLNRPVDVLSAPDGSLLVADTDTGGIYRVSYVAR